MGDKPHCSRVVIFDGYVDEPTALGVPPYVSPYPRYVAGAAACAGLPFEYIAVDGWRDSRASQELVAELGDEDLLVVVTGLTVPGHYRGGTPLTLFELERLLGGCPARRVVGGPIRHGYTITGGSVALAPEAMPSVPVVAGDIDAWVADFLAGTDLPEPRRRTYAEMANRAVLGASVVARHPRFPHVIAELETARGCERDRHCSFCTEGLLDGAEFRRKDDIVAEVEALYGAGLRHFRLGKQPNFFAWPGRRIGEQVVPFPEAVEELYLGIRAVAPGLKTLHIDNVNPGFVANHVEECGRIVQIIAKHNTGGDVAAFGLESADPVVCAANDLKASAEKVRLAVEAVNRFGARRKPEDGLSALLPGINLLCGLPGESAATYELNFEFLRGLLESGLLVRRINIRQVMSFPGTGLARALAGRPVRVRKARFHRFKRRVAEEIERPMLRRIAPLGTVLRGVITEFHDGDVTFGRQLASYPLLVGIPWRLSLGLEMDVFIVGHGYRSVTGLPLPFAVNYAPEKAIAGLPGIGRKRARRIVDGRPYGSVDGLFAALDDASTVAPWVGFFSFDFPPDRG